MIGIGGNRRQMKGKVQTMEPVNKISHYFKMSLEPLGQTRLTRLQIGPKELKKSQLLQGSPSEQTDEDQDQS